MTDSDAISAPRRGIAPSSSGPANRYGQRRLVALALALLIERESAGPLVASGEMACDKAPKPPGR